MNPLLTLGVFLSIITPMPGYSHSAAATDAPRFDFKGATLGMTTDEWKKLPYPGSDAAIPACSSDPDDAGKSIYSGDRNREVGIVTCGYVVKDSDSYQSAWINIGDQKTDQVFYLFYQSHLYFIGIIGGSSLFPEAMDGLKAKFGQPTSTSESSVQNGFGATFPKSVMIWKRNNDTLIAQNPDQQINECSITILDESASNAIDKLRNNLPANKDKM